jgi:hypothetical protein
MKIIEAMKKVKELEEKARDLREKIQKFCVYLSFETPTYENQKEKVEGWLQAHSDVVKEISRLRAAIQKTNVSTEVTIQLGEAAVTKTITEWIYRRAQGALLEKKAWSVLTDRDLKEGVVTNTSGEQVNVKLIRCYDPNERDKRKELYTSEPHIIDGRLEVINAITDLIE